ncbi:orotate phosphoribosyltransferase-like protein [Cupriavidus metallidurans]|uniref:LPD38 domain-containing protein n=1 Tax=Cupriavidus metallidurans TaxID=119219 RepID=UPI00049300DE|nr:LPD38 domain-containing protein [Cupriavidus metallidurans]
MTLQDFGSFSLTNTPTGAQDNAPARNGRRGSTTPLDAATVDRIMTEEGAAAIRPAVMGIYGQESGGGTNARRSTDGAIGGMQVMPGTFDRIKKPGEDINNPEDNFRVGVRYLKLMADRFGNDPGRLAAGYFSGEGNVSTSGDTPYKEDRKDGNGKSVSSYVRDVLGRIGNAAVPSAQAAEKPAEKPAENRDFSKAPTWKDVTDTDEWRAMSPEKQAQTRDAYFQYYVGSTLREGQRGAAKTWFDKQATGIEAAQPGLLSRAGRAVLDAMGQGEASAEGAAVNPSAMASPAAPSKIGVMGQQSAPAAPVTPTTSRAPVTPEFRDQVNRAYDAATPAERERMAQADGVVGQLVRERTGQFAAAPTVPTAGKFDTRAEARAARLAADGADHQTADTFARTGAERGVTPGTELGTVGKSDFDFEAQQRFNKDPVFSNPVIRAAVKGYEGYRSGSLGLAQALFDATGNQEFADIARQGIADSQRRTAAIGDKGDGLQRNFEGAVSSIAQQLPALLAGVATGTEVVPLAAMFTQTFGQEYGQGRAQGLDGAQAATRAGIFGAFEVIGEKFGLGQTLQALKMAGRGAAAQDIASVLAKGLLREIPGEQLTTLGQFLTDKVPGIGTNLEAGLTEYLQQAGDTLAQTVMQGGLMMGGTTGVSAGVRHLQGAESQQSQALGAEQARETALNKAATFFQAPRQPHASTQAAEQVVREMAADAGMDPTELLPAQRTVPPAAPTPVAAPVPAPVADPAQAEPAAIADGAQAQVDGADIAGMSDAILAAEAAQGENDGSERPVPAEVVDPRGATPDAGMGVDQTAGSASAVPGGDAGQASALPAAPAGADAVPGAGRPADGQPALSDELYSKAVDAVRSTRSPAVAVVQRHLGVDYNTASDLLNRMEREGVVTPQNERGVRSVVAQESARQHADEPPIAPGMTRLYHGGDIGRYDGNAWFSTNRAYAEGYATKDGRTGAEVQYVDYPTDKINALADPDGYGQTPAKGHDFQVELSSDETGPRKPLHTTPLDAAAHEAATSPANDLLEPTDAQKAAGNYKMGHATLHGLDITIENPRGSTRSGTDQDGKPWSVDMANHYGYIKRTEGADGDHVDAFIGPNPDSTHVFVVDQVDPRIGKFDEHKVMLGFDSLKAAREGYHANYEKGWKGAAAITPMSVDEFKAWLKNGDTTKPIDKKAGRSRTEKQAKAARAASGESTPAAKVKPKTERQLREESTPATPKPLDHGELNVPGRTNGINAALDRHNAEKAAAQKQKRKADSAATKEAKARAKDLFAKHVDGLVAAYGQKYDAKEFRAMLDGMAKWEPKKFIALAEKYQKEQAEAPTAPEPTVRTNTEAFRRWFGDSKVVTEDVKPMVMYHGTSASESGDAFTAFDTYASNYGLMGMGGYFTADPTVASSYTAKGKGTTPTVYPVYLSIKNPIDMDAKADADAWKKQFSDIEHYHEGGNTNESWYRAAEESLIDQEIPKWEGAEVMQDGLRAMGYDGITHEGGGRVDKDGVRHRVFIAFDPQQIKSAIGNQGTYDAARPELVFSRASDGGVAADSLRAKFAPIVKNWANGPNGGVVVVQSVDELPSHLAEYLRSAGEDGRAEGFYLPKSDRVYLIADNLPSHERAQAVLFHEVYGHKGMRAFLAGDQYAEMMDRIRRANPAIARAADAWFEQYGEDTLHANRDAGQANAEAERNARLLAVEEALADLASTVPVAGPVRKLLAALQAALRKIGLHTVADWMEGRSEAETFALLRAARDAVFGDTVQGNIHVATADTAPAFARGDRTVNLPDAIIGNTLGSATSLPDYAAAKAGDEVAAIAVAAELVTPDLVEKVRAVIGDAKPIVVGVASIEATGRNKIPVAAAVLLADRLGLETTGDLVQANRPKRTSLGGLDRIFAAPDFTGPVVAGAQYVLVDDTLTQGATFAAMASHIEENGGHVLAVVALTGKQYSAKLNASPETLQRLRDKYGDIEQAFRAATGYGFDALTQSEARYLASFEPAQSVRDRVLAAGNEAIDRTDEAPHSPLDGDGPLFARAQQSPQQQTNLPLYGGAPAQGGAPTAPRWQAPDPTRMDRLVYELQNRQVDLKRVQAAIRESVGPIPEQFDGYLKEEVYHGRVATRVNKFLEREVRPLIEEMRSSNVRMDELEAYLWARHAPERNAQIATINPDLTDGGSGLTNRQAADYMAGADVKDSAGEVIVKGLDRSKLTALQALAGRIDRMTAGTNQILIQYGLESPDTIAAWTGTYRHYVPLKREDMDGVTPIGQGFSVKGSASKRALGSTRKVTDILANIALAREAAITRGEKNRVTLALYGLALTNPNADFWTTDKAPMIKVLDASTGLVVKRPDPSYKNKDNVIVLRVQGLDRTIALNARDPRAMRIAEAMKNLDVQPFGEVMGAVASVTRFLAAINTQYNPVFGLLNGVRDLQGAVLNLSSTPIADKRAFVVNNAPAALRAIWRAERHGDMTSQWAELYDRLQLAGGTTGYREIFRAGTERAEALQSEIDSLDRSTPRKVLDYMLDWLDHYNTAIENALRLTAFKAALDKGLSEERAASVAKNLTVNFNRKGRMGRELGALYAFFNAAVQGTARMLETLDPRTRHGKAILIGGMMVGVLQAIVGAAAMDEDDWEAIPEFTKQRNFIIPLGKSYAMIPMPLGFNVLPNIGRILAEAVQTRGKKWRNQVPELLGVLLDNANPIGSGTFAQILAPTVADPIIALAENKDFTGRPIYKEDSNQMRPKPGFQRAKDAASTVSKGIAYGANWATGGTDYTPGLVSPTPDQLDYLFGTITGGLGRELNKVYQTAELMAKGKDVPEYKKPIIGRFYGNFDGDADTAGRYWAVVRSVNEKRNELDGRRKDGKDAAGYLAENPELKLSKAIEKTQAAIGKLHKVKDQIEMNPNLREEDRTAQMDAIDQQAAKMMRTIIDMSKEMKPR